ncbi:Alpha-aminoadipic semialdehyde synthase, mitochondrial [Trichoplax sp. H2]|nr:Alpha-aminoadipic semialdehyde synthase, mitochondrial [Trichoplax sp. H2]|eukprot:RDD44671.1 Alpha-aminoadipic semialdehyde synthase, mitochondrial [Trichoplax sp. H2]
MLRASSYLQPIHRLAPTRVWTRQSSKYSKVIAIRREDYLTWERRAPLGPKQVNLLVEEFGYKVIVQPSAKRAFTGSEYEECGAILQEDISQASLVVGVKQVPIDKLLPNKTYCFFSHTIKAQADNMPLLDAILEKKIKLIDYERLVDSSGKRLVAFGQFAGIAGMINILHGMGVRLLNLGFHTPFMYICSTHHYASTTSAKVDIAEAGSRIRLGQMPTALGPLTFVFTGTGNVFQGAKEIFQQLPHEFVSPNDLKEVTEHGDTRKVYGTIVTAEDHIESLDGSKFDKGHFRKFPEQYRSNFADKIAPYMSVLINGLYWGVGDPRLLTCKDARNLMKIKPTATKGLSDKLLPHRLLAISDISADPQGSIEFLYNVTNIGDPFEVYDPVSDAATRGVSGDGILITSIDNLPTQLPREATDFFGNLLLPHLIEMAKAEASVPFKDITKVSEEVMNATIASNGELTPKFEYIRHLRNERLHVSSPRKKNVLLLGSGFVARPVVEYLTRDPDISITIASASIGDANDIAKTYRNTAAMLFRLGEEKALDQLKALISRHDLTVSLLPYTYHPQVAKFCLACDKHMVTASYVSPAMKELHQSALDKNLVFLNEMGLDPGIDHMLAAKCFDEVRAKGGKISSYVSYCGGLPAPELSDNPLRYKFSWSPRGALLAILNGARYRTNGEIKEIHPGGSLLAYTKDVDYYPGLNLEGYPNRDSMMYADLYDITSAHTGFSEVATALLKIGVINGEPNPILMRNAPDIQWHQLTANLLGLEANISIDDLKSEVLKRVSGNENKLKAIIDLGLLSDQPVAKEGTTIDALSALLSKSLTLRNKIFG